MKKWFILCAIVLAAFAIRAYKVSSLPPAMSWDEVSIGYNAYSILKTAKDEHGRLLPLDAFIAYGDYKPPLSIYATVPFVAAFGLNELSVRLPSVLAGTAMVFFVYLLAGQLLGSYKRKEEVGLIAAGLLAFSPWHILLSRAGFEANIAACLMVAGAWLLLSTRTHPKRALIAYLPFVAGVYTFNSARYFAPLLALGLTIYIYSAIRKNRKQFAIGVAVAALSLFPILGHLVSPEARLRLAEVNIFSEHQVVIDANMRMQSDGDTWWSKIVHNRRVGYARSYVLHFLDHFQPSFLFIRGDGNPKFSIQDVGQMYLIEAPFLVMGVLWAFGSMPKVAWFLVFWLIAAIAPAAIARETPHALRIENSLPVWQFFTAMGIAAFFAGRKGWIWKAVRLSVVMVFAAGVAYFSHNYFTHYSKEFSGEWQYGYRQALEKAEALNGGYDTVVISDVIGRPYMYTLFHTLYDPEEFLNSRDSYFDAAGFYHVKGFGKYRFTHEEIGEAGPYEGKVLYIQPPGMVPPSGTVVDTVTLLNGEPVLILFEQ